MFLLSLILHGAVLFFPAPPSQEEAKESEEVAVQITSLPEPAEQVLDEDSSDEPLPEPEEEEEPAPAASNPVPQAAPPASEPERSLPPPPSDAIPPTPSDESPSAQQTTSVSQPPPEPEAPVLDPQPQPSAPLPFASFPHLTDASAGCFGVDNCHQVEDRNFRQISTELIDRLEAQGYEVRSRDDLEVSGLKVYEVTQDGVTRYLSLLQPELDTSVYVLAAQPVTISELQQAELLKQQFEEIVQTTSNGRPARYSDFSNPDYFYDGQTQRAEVSEALYTVVNPESGDLAEAIAAQLSAAGFGVNSIGHYVNAPLYEVHQGPFVAYLSILPTEDRAGNILVSWNSLPQTP